jgi:hypothetical protein
MFDKFKPGVGVKILIFSILLNIVITSTGIFLYDYLFATKIVAVDLKGFIARHRDLYTTGKITDKQLLENIDALERYVLTLKANEVAVMADAVVRNAKRLRLPNEDVQNDSTDKR